MNEMMNVIKMQIIGRMAAIVNLAGVFDENCVLFLVKSVKFHLIKRRGILCIYFRNLGSTHNCS